MPLAGRRLHPRFLTAVVLALALGATGEDAPPDGEVVTDAPEVIADLADRPADVVADVVASPSSIYSHAMARCMAALAKLAYCDPGPEAREAALQATTQGPCGWVGLEVEEPQGLGLAPPAPPAAPPAPPLLNASKDGERRVLEDESAASPMTATYAPAVFGYIVKFSRAEEANADAMPDRGCVVVLKGAANSDGAGEDEDEGGDELYWHRLEEWEDKARVVPVYNASNGTVIENQTVWCRGCKVSAGYKILWEEMRPVVLDRLRNASCLSGDAIFVTGHSAGAAVATLAMFSLQAQEGYRVQLSYNFGSPRIGNEAFSDNFRDLFGIPVPLFRVTHAGDRIPRLPRSDWGYKHVGLQVWYSGDSEKDFVVCGNITAETDCGNRGLPFNETCPLNRTKCENATQCDLFCEGYDLNGPHCKGPVAPGSSFCIFNRTNSEDEFGPVTIPEELVGWERSCTWSLRYKQAQDLADKEAQAKQEKKDKEEEDPNKEEEVPDAAPDAVVITAPDGKEKEVKLPDGCLKQDMTFQPLDMSGQPFSKEANAVACQVRCMKIKECAFFNFFQRETEGDCHVTGHDAYEQPGSVGFVSGPKVCGRGWHFLAQLKNGTVTSPDELTWTFGWYVPGLLAAGTLALYSCAIVCLGRQSKAPAAGSSGLPPLSLHKGPATDGGGTPATPSPTSATRLLDGRGAGALSEAPPLPSLDAVGIMGDDSL